MISLDSTSTYTREDPVALLDERLRRLRRRYAGRRILDTLAVAVTMDILLDFLAFVTHSLFQWSFHVPFFLEIFLAVLLTREASRLKKDRFTQILDRRFKLQDRLYSFWWYNGPHSVSKAVRVAQAWECLKSIDFNSLDRKLKPRVPPIMLVTLPVFLGLTWWYLNVDYKPPGTFTTTVLKVVVPQRDKTQRTSGEEGPLERRTGLNDGESRETVDEDRTDGSENGALTSESALEGEGTEPAEPGASTGEANPSPGGGVGPELDRDDAGRGSPAAGGEVAQPEGPIQSNPVSEEVSEVGPARLRGEPSLVPPSVREPDHLISLLPWSSKGSSKDGNAYVPDIPGFDVNQYPVQYRSHLTRYQKELQTWATTK